MWLLKRVQAFCKNTFIDPNDDQQLLDLFGMYNISLHIDDFREYPKELVKIMLDNYVEEGVTDLKRQLEINYYLFKFILLHWLEYSKKSDEIDFDDMIWYPLIHKYTDIYKYDFILVDEAQDLNNAQFELIKMLCKPTTKLIFVGDKKQAIYGFRGANVTSMDDIERYFDCKPMPLSINYRCAKSHIQYVQQFVPEIEAYEKNPEGKIYENITFDDSVELIKNNDMVLCRTNAPLVQYALHLIKS